MPGRAVTFSLCVRGLSADAGWKKKVALLVRMDGDAEEKNDPMKMLMIKEPGNMMMMAKRRRRV